MDELTDSRRSQLSHPPPSATLSVLKAGIRTLADSGEESGHKAFEDPPKLPASHVARAGSNGPAILEDPQGGTSLAEHLQHSPIREQPSTESAHVTQQSTLPCERGTQPRHRRLTTRRVGIFFRLPLHTLPLATHSTYRFPTSLLLLSISRSATVSINK